MGNSVEYLRLTADELERIKSDPDWAWNHMEDVREGEEAFEPPPRDARYYAIGSRAVQELLLERAGFPVDVINGEQPIRYPDPRDGDYHYLTADQVATAAGALAALPSDRLLAHTDPGELVETGRYPDAPTATLYLDAARHEYDGLAEFLGAAAHEGRAVLVWQL
ncbi:DUF1877 family protein [Streptomyces sp. NPDC057438]|uniref:DUF1877 family protein n=1 Tax=Streptomyces sp. NPDC057438 TaxID=3346133 RepID=UPI0036C38F7E